MEQLSIYIKVCIKGKFDGRKLRFIVVNLVQKILVKHLGKFAI